jgi:hypothetical protein
MKSVTLTAFFLLVALFSMSAQADPAEQTASQSVQKLKKASADWKKATSILGGASANHSDVRKSDRSLAQQKALKEQIEFDRIVMHTLAAGAGEIADSENGLTEEQRSKLTQELGDVIQKWNP